MQKIGRFENAILIGEGVSSSVYSAFDGVTDSKLAIKVLKSHLAQDQISLLRFKREIELTRQLSHPNIIKIYDLFEVNQTVALSMEFLTGHSLSEYIKIQGSLDWQSFYKVFAQLLSAIKYCHAKKIIHRDIKPQNIFVNENLKATVLDFGISRITALSDLTQTGTSLGTPEYMAPELYSSSFFDPRSDIYALGVVAYEMLTGQLPFQGESLYILFEKQANSIPKPIREFREDVPAWFENVVYKMIRNDIAERYQTISDIEYDFNASHFFEDSAVEVDQDPCIKCQQKTPVLFEICLNCGFKPQQAEATNGTKYSLYLSANNRSESVAKFMATFHYKKPLGLSKSKSLKLMNHLPIELVPIFKLHAQNAKVNVFAQEENVHGFAKANAAFLVLGSLLLAPYLVFLYFWAERAVWMGQNAYFAESGRPSSGPGFFEKLNGLDPAFDSLVKEYIFWPESSLPVWALVILSGCMISYVLKLMLLFAPPLIRNWRLALGARAQAFNELSNCLRLHATLQISEHRAWGKKFLLLYLKTLKPMPKGSENQQTLFSILAATFEILSLMDAIRISISTQRKSGQQTAESVMVLEESYSEAAVRLMTLDSLLTRISRNVIGQNPEQLVVEMSEAKECLSSANMTLQTLQGLNSLARQAA